MRSCCVLRAVWCSQSLLGCTLAGRHSLCCAQVSVLACSSVTSRCVLPAGDSEPALTSSGRGKLSALSAWPAGTPLAVRPDSVLCSGLTLLLYLLRRRGVPAGGSASIVALSCLGVVHSSVGSQEHHRPDNVMAGSAKLGHSRGLASSLALRYSAHRSRSASTCTARR